MTCFIKDRAAIRERDFIGIDNLAWECDYPHSDTTWPRSPETVFPDFEGCRDEEINKITHLNAMRMYQFDPFKHLPREDCTVGSLRAKAQNVDLSYLSSEGVIKTSEQGKTPTMAEIEAKIARGIGSNQSWVGEIKEK
jgi:hypothetical protein